MRKCVLLTLYIIALAGITAHLFFEIKWMGFVGYAALIVSSASEIIRMLKEKN